ncbi:MAG: hypothetical protein H3C43_09960 [Leptonema sp. (in: Bacteria)]|nr:hypothetical protein [Leptonema sp. (in: bacteria)]
MLNKTKIYLYTSIGILTSVVFFATSCGDRQKLASLEIDGKPTAITRGDLKKFIFASQGQIDDSQLSVTVQDNILQNISLLFSAAAAAKSESIDKTEAYTKNLVFMDRRSLISGFDLYLKMNGSSHKFTMMDLQILFLSPNNSDKADELLQKLNSAKNDSEIQEIMFASNENEQYRVQAGYIDPFCISCAQNPLSDITDTLKDKTDKKFIKHESIQGVWLLRNLKVKEVTTSSLERVFIDFQLRAQKARNDYNQKLSSNKVAVMTDDEIKAYAKDYASHQIRQETSNALRTEIDQLRQNHTITFNNNQSKEEKWASIPEDTAIILSIDDTKYHYSDFKKELEGFDFNADQQFDLFIHIYVPSELLKKSKNYTTVAKSGQIEYIHQLYIQGLLAQLYLNQRLSKVTVTDEDIQQQYQLRQFNEYKGKSLAQVKDEIVLGLTQEKQQSAQVSIKQDLFKKYNVVIERDKLKDGQL